jgi:hypothetical protein
MPYKQAPKSAALKALIGNQKNLPEALKQKILDAPETPAKQAKVIAQKTTIDKKTGKKTVEEPKELATEKITAKEFFKGAKADKKTKKKLSSDKYKSPAKKYKK